MTPEVGTHFDSIESAHDFVALLSQAVAETRREIEADVEREMTGKSPRRLEALRLASYTLEKLELHTTRSARILNDLRSLRRLLFEERKMHAAKTQPKSGTTPVIVLAANPPVPMSTSAAPTPSATAA